MTPWLRTVGAGLVSAALATVAKTRAEQVLQPLSEKIAPPAPVQRVAIGADPAGHPENMPPAEVADRVIRDVAGEQLGDDQREQASTALHWVMGMSAGLGYALLAARVPAVRTGRGVVAGAVLFVLTHGSTLPAAGVQHPPWVMPTAWWGWELGSHLVYGATLDAGLALVGSGAPR